MVDPGGSMCWLLIVPLSSFWGIQILNLGGSQELILVDPNVGSLTRTDKLEYTVWSEVQFSDRGYDYVAPYDN